MNDDRFLEVYGELRELAAAKLAGELPGHTLNPTALVHEVYLRLTAKSSLEGSVFFPLAAEAMRRILVDHARKKKATKRGGAARKFELTEGDRISATDPDTVLMIDEALEKLKLEDPDSESIARLRLFAGLEVAEAADALGISRATAFRDWAYARAYLTNALS